MQAPITSASIGTAGPVVRACGPLFCAAAEGSRPHAGAAGRQRKEHTIERSVAELFGTLQLTLQLVALVSSLLSLMPSSMHTSRAPPSRSS